MRVRLGVVALRSGRCRCASACCPVPFWRWRCTVVTVGAAAGAPTGVFYVLSISTRTNLERSGRLSRHPGHYVTLDFARIACCTFAASRHSRLVVVPLFRRSNPASGEREASGHGRASRCGWSFDVVAWARGAAPRPRPWCVRLYGSESSSALGLI